ncbi:MAG: hypothetical protein R3E82_21530 [Pseudomonadales bacterium]
MNAPAASAASPAAFPVYQFPEFSLSMSAADARAWAREHDFVEIAGTEPEQEAWERVHANSYRQLIQFIPAARGLSQLLLTQDNVVGTSRTLARQIVTRYGEPSQTEDLGNTTRLTYAYPHSVPARRVFITGPNRLIMGLITEEQLALAHSAAVAAQASLATDAGTDAAPGSGSLLPVWAWFSGVVMACFVALIALVTLLPAHPGGKLRSWLRRLGEALLGFLSYTTLSLFTMAMGILIYPLFIVSGCGAGVFALEQGTSWFWVVPWLIGVACTVRSDEESGILNLVVANGFFLLALFGPMLELAWSANLAPS